MRDLWGLLPTVEYSITGSERNDQSLNNCCLRPTCNEYVFFYANIFAVVNPFFVGAMGKIYKVRALP